MINKLKERRVLKPEIAGEVGTLLQGVVKKGSATRAQIPGVMIAGKTGTTENYGDAWFVGWTRELTVAVWVGYPDELRPMETEFNGEPVAGGTYPAAIWKAFVEKARTYEEYCKPDEEDQDELPTSPDAPATPGTPAPTTPAAPAPDTAPAESAPPAAEQPAPAAGEQPAPADSGGVPPG